MNSDIIKLILRAIDEGFNIVSQLVKTYEPREIIYAVAAYSNISPLILAKHPMGGYSKGGTSGAYYYCLTDLKTNITKYEWLYSKLEDQASREVFNNLILYRILPNREFLIKAFDGENPQYFDKNIITASDNEVFVDCGGYIGDTVQSYLSSIGKYKRIYVYEPNTENVEKCHVNLAEYQNIIINQAGVGAKSDELTLTGSDSSGGFIHHNNNVNANKTRIVSLDDDITEPVTFIKMDVEGFEVDALNGARRHIHDDNPKLAICLYHVVSDFWEIPELIHSINQNYRYFLRHYNREQNWETVLYAIPEEQNINIQTDDINNENIGVWAPYPFNNGLVNQQLLKDCGIVPYMFHKQYGYNSTLISCKNGEYPYLESLPGLSIDFLPDCSNMGELLKASIYHLIEHYKSIDILILYGPYQYNLIYVNIYRKLRPDGKVYMALDANSAWMDRINWAQPQFSAMLDACDVIGASSRKLQKHLNRKWNRWMVEYIPNGFFDPTSSEVNVSFEQKENIILTVGRIGTSQKANHILLEAFAKVHSELDGWCIHMVGEVDEAFKKFLPVFFMKYPELREKVIFKGLIEDKSTLYNEYAKAKIFVLTSIFEGGNPNVVAEALYHGCYMITSDIDASEDITDNGTVGKVFPVNDVYSLADTLRDVCSDDNLLKETFPRILEYAKNNFDWNVIIQRLHHMLKIGDNDGDDQNE